MTNAEMWRHLRSSGFTLTKNIGHDADWQKGSVTVRGPGSPDKNKFNIGRLRQVLREIDEACRVALQQKRTMRTPTHGELRPGQRVRTRRTFVDVPAGTVGTISEDYGSGFMVAWDLPNQEAVSDGFDKSAELHFLEIA